MSYIYKAYYEQLYGPLNMTDNEFNVLSNQATDLIDSITQYRIVQGGGIAALPPLWQELEKKATAAQVLYFTQNGMDTVLTGESGQGFTVGKVHVDGKGASGTGSGNTAAQSMVSPFAIALLEQTGLMRRDVSCLGPYHNNFLGIW